MCLAIVQPKGAQTPELHLENGINSNPHGAGYAFVDKQGKIAIRKGYFSFRAFMNQFERDSENNRADSPFLIHFRWATSGNKDYMNCHPFAVRGGAMIHNGILDLKPTATKSDTHVFSLQLGQHLDRVSVMEANEELGKAIGRGNKLAFLYEDREYAIINESEGVWDNGIWYSNTGYKTSYGGTGGCSAGMCDDEASMYDAYGNFYGAQRVY